MELIETMSVFLKEWGPIALGILGTIGVVITSVVVIWTKVKGVIQPVLDFMSRDKEDRDVAATALAKIDSIKNDTLKLDLLAKIQNPTLSDEIKAGYQTQLERLVAISPAEEMLAIGEEISKYS